MIAEFYKRGEIQTEQQFSNALGKWKTIWMELPRKLLEQTVFNRKPKNEKHMLIVKDKPTHDENLPQ